MRSVNRRQLNHNLAQVLDEVLATGEPVEIITRGAPPLVLSLKQESLFDGWLRLGLIDDVVPDLDALDAVSPQRSTRTTKEILANVRGGR